MKLIRIDTPEIAQLLPYVRQYCKKIRPKETYITKCYSGNVLVVTDEDKIKGYLVVKKEGGTLIVLEASVKDVGKVVNALKEYAYENGCYEIIFASARKGWEKKIKAKPMSIIYSIGG